jgi:hypothetical protein
VPDALYERLRQRADQESRSLSAEVIALLQLALGTDTRSQREILESVRRRRFFKPDAAPAPDSTALLREDRRR